MGETRLLISDVDDTLLSSDNNDSSTEAFAAWYSQHRDAMRLVYASGRFVDSICASIKNTALPEPDLVIGGVGTEMREYTSGKVISDWPAAINPQVASGKWNPAAVRAALTNIAGLEDQPDEFQSAFKISYFYRNASEKDLAVLQERLLQSGIDANLIYSSARDLDVLPAGVNKGSAAQFAARYLKISSDFVMTSGNSTNDLELFKVGFRGIVVGNAHEELKQQAAGKVYLANQECAFGVMEGIQHWFGDL